MAIILKFPYHRVKGLCPTVAQAVTALQQAQAVDTDVATPTPAPKAGNQQKDSRKDMLAKIHIALLGNNKTGESGFYKTLPGFTEDVYRFTLEEKWGVQSAAQMDHEQLHQCLLWLGSLGFKSSSPYWRGRDGRGMSQLSMISRIEQLLTEKGKIQDRFSPLSYADGILKRQTAKAEGGPVESVYKASPKQLRAVIAALDKDGKRSRRRVNG